MFSILIYILNIYIIILLARVIMSWISNLDHSNPIVQFLMQVTEPVLQPIRSALPSMGGIDISPIIVLVILQVLIGVLKAL